MIQRMFVTLDTKKTNYKNVGKINHGDDLILELTVLSDGDMISFNNPMVDLLVKKSDGKMIRQNSGIEHIKPNKFIIEVKKDCVTSPGLSTNQLIINDNGRISTCMFYYTILNSLEEDIIESISNVEVLEQLDEFTIQIKDKMENFDEELQNRMSELEDAIDDLVEFFGDTSVDLLEAELSRNEAEQSRAQAELIRVQNENRRLQNDLNLANAEAERVRAENIRIQNEVDRALVDAVMDQKESKREDSELERIQNESKRATDELVRQQNENARQSNESIRMSNENDRKTQENRRVTAETNRVNAETTRRNNENSRISNEIERQKAMNEMKSLIGNVNDFDERVGVIEDEIEEINSSLEHKDNLKLNNLQNKFDKNNITPGKFQNGEGTIINSSSHIIGQLTNAENVKTVIIRNPFSIGLRLGEYDEQGNFITRTSKSTTELIINLNPNTKYIRFGCNKEALDTVRMFFIEKDKTYNMFGETLTENNTLIANSKDINIEQYYFIDEKVKTKYWITYIPRTDEKGNINELKLGFANNMIDGDIFPETPRSFANRNNATVCINAGVSWSAYGGNEYYNEANQKCCKMHGLRVYEHMLVSNDIESNWYKKTHWALGIKDDGTLVSFGTADSNGDMTMSYEQSQQLGCKFVTSAFTPIMINGVSQKEILEYKNQWLNDDGTNVYYQRQVIGQNTTTKDIFILTSNGKGTGKNSEGLIIDGGIPLDNCIDILKNFGCDFAYQLDEGGSTSLIYKGIQINDKTDDGGKSERQLSDFLYVGTNPINDRDKDIRDIRKELSDLKNKMGCFNKLFLESETDNTREIQRWVNGSLKHSLNLKNGALQYYDSPNKKTIFGIDTSGLITTMLGISGFFPKELAAITSEYFPNYSTCFLYPPNVNNAPFTVNAFVIHLVSNTGGQIQIAFAYTSGVGGDLYPKWRIKMGEEWKSWNKFSN